MFEEIKKVLKNINSNKKAFLFGFLRTQSLIIKIILITIAVILIVPLLMYSFPIAKYVMIIIIIFFIFDIVVRSFGNNVLSYLVTAVLLYFLVYKYLFLTTSVLIFYFFLSAGIMSVFVWGTSKFSKK
jgi:hypothetical protein